MVEKTNEKKYTAQRNSKLDSSGVITRGVFTKNGLTLPNMADGMRLAAFTPGIRQFAFGTPILLENNALYMGPEYEYKMSDFIRIAHAFEQPKVDESYLGDTYGRTEPEFTNAEKTAMLTALNNINMEYTIKNITMANDIKFLGLDNEAYFRIWDEVYSDPEKYHAIQNILLNAELTASRALSHGVFTKGAVSIVELEKAFDMTQLSINELKVSDKVRNLMSQELNDLRQYCRDHQDNIAKIVSLDDYDKGKSKVSISKLGIEHIRFIEMLDKEIKQINWSTAEPEITFLHKDDLRKYFDELNDTSPDAMIEANEKIYNAIMDKIEQDVKVIHTYEKPFRTYDSKELDDLGDEDTPMPFAITYSITTSNDAADRHECNIIVSDGKTCTFEKISMDSDGSISNAKVDVGFNGIVADLNKEAVRDTVSDEREEIQTIEQTEQPVIETEQIQEEGQLEEIQMEEEPQFTATAPIFEKAESNEKISVVKEKLDITEIIAVAPDEPMFNEDDFFEEI